MPDWIADNLAYWIMGFGCAAILLLFLYANGLLSDRVPRSRFWRHFH